MVFKNLSLTVQADTATFPFRLMWTEDHYLAVLIISRKLIRHVLEERFCESLLSYDSSRFLDFHRPLPLSVVYFLVL